MAVAGLVLRAGYPRRSGFEAILLAGSGIMFEFWFRIDAGDLPSLSRIAVIADVEVATFIQGAIVQLQTSQATRQRALPQAQVM